MRRKVALKVVASVVIVLFVFSVGFWLGINFVSIKKYVSKGNSNSLSEDNSNFLKCEVDFNLSFMRIR